MPYPGNFYRLVVEGSGYAPERWSYSLSMAEPGGSFVGTGATTVPQSIIDAVRAFHTAAGQVHQAARLDSIKFNVVKPDGRYLINTNTAQHIVNPPLAGQVATYPPPPQITIAATLMTARMRGRGSRGRFYPPYPPMDSILGTTGLVDESVCANRALVASRFISALNAATSPDNPDVAGLAVVVASDLGDGVFEPVTGVEVGRVMDTMRSRRTSLKEARIKSAEAVVPPP